MNYKSKLALSISVLASAVCSTTAFAQDAAAEASVDAPAGSEIIVTGTRVTGVTVAQSPTPIMVLNEESMSRVGQPNLNQVLTQLVPSFTAQAFGGDAANLTLSARLRGLSPNHTLVLVNGKRRHGTANLAVNGSPYQGAAAADLDLISPSSIKRVEVLEDGAAAQYGSDAIAGVINIILKDDAEGGDGYVTAGKHYDTGGDTYAATLHLGTKIGDSGFVNITAFHRYHDFTQVGGLDRRVTDTNGVLRTNLTPAQQALYLTIPGFPYVNKIYGDAESHLTNLQLNSGYDFGSVQVYAFGTYSKRNSSSNQNLRVPDRILGNTPPNGGSGVLGAPGTTIPFPNGFTPRLSIREDDYSVTGGVKGEAGNFTYDLSTTYGQDKNLIYTLDSANRSLYLDTGFTPRDFYNGMFKATELTANADFTTEFEVGFAEPLNVAFGAEYRRNTYTIGSGDPGSIYKEGGQAYPGFRPVDARTNSRNNQSLYLDVAAAPVEGLRLDGAVRYEHYSDFGDNVIFKGTGRYDFSDVFAVRGTVSTGFRAPTLAESFYSATTVSPTSAFVLLPANSAAAKLLGFQNLRPEKSTSFSVGVVVRPAPRLTITVDAYQTNVRDRILGTGTLFGSGGGNIVIGGVSYSANFPIVRTAILANGNVLDPTVVQTGLNIFTNGADTRTRGVEATVSYQANLGSGNIAFTLAGNYNETEARNIQLAPTQLTPTTAGGVPAPTPIRVFDQVSISNLETASPKLKIILSATPTFGRLSATLRGTLFGDTSNFATPDGGTYYKQTIPSTVIADVELGYELIDGLKLSVGANNLFNKMPPRFQLVPGTTSFTPVNAQLVIDGPLQFSPYGINGGYYYARLNFKF